MPGRRASESRTTALSRAGSVANLAYSLFLFALAFVQGSAWFWALAVAFATANAIRLYAVTAYRRGASPLSVYRNVGRLLPLVVLALSGVGVLVVRDGMGAVYPGYVVYAAATYTFTSLTLAIVNLVRRRGVEPLDVRAVRAAGLACSLLSLVLLQTALLGQFGEGESPADHAISNALTCTGVSVVIVSESLFMLAKSRAQRQASRLYAQGKRLPLEQTELGDEPRKRH